MEYYTVIDIGASSGRIMLADLEGGDFHFKEIHRFSNQFQFADGHERWDINYIFKEVLAGLGKLTLEGVESCSLGIDTWAVDYCLVDVKGNLLAHPVSYRDSRTKETINKVTKLLPKETIYQKTGIQFLNFNTLYQLYEEDRILLDQTNQILMIPDYLTFLLTGKKTGEVTNASSTQMLNLKTKDYDEDILRTLGIDRKTFPTLIHPGTVIGKVSDKICLAEDLPQITVTAVATHDTASAILGIPATEKNWAYVSSGTWSLIGIESDKPINTKESFEANYTNEWGGYGTYRFLKNITGMWCVQEISRLLDYRYTYNQLSEMASQVKPFQQYVDLNDARFINPENMIEEIQNYCLQKGEKVPQTIGELVMCVYSNLALAYYHELKNIENLSGKKIETLYIVGGGSNVSILNQLTADVTKKKVSAGPVEGTALGNLLVQMIADNRFTNIDEARRWLAQQVEMKVFHPQN